MGVAYKLKPEVENYILELKKKKPELSCRGMAALVNERFNLALSKSSINAFIKKAGLSLPIGRRPKPRRKRPSRLSEVISEASQVFAAPPAVEETPIAPEKIEPVLPPAQVIPPEATKPPVEPSVKAQVSPPVAPPEEEKIPPAPATTPLPKGKEEVTPSGPAEAEKESHPTLEPKKPKETPPPAAEVPREEKPVTPEETITSAEPARPTVAMPEGWGTESWRESVLAAYAPLEVLAPRPPQLKLPQEQEGLGAILLKAADYLCGGTFALADAIRRRLKIPIADLLPKTEALIYAPAFGGLEKISAPQLGGLSALINGNLRSEDITSFQADLDQVKLLSSDLLRALSTCFSEARGIQISLSNNRVFYLDAQLHTLWSTPQVPYDFCAPVFYLKNWLENYFLKDEPCILLAAPGYDTPSPELFDFLHSFEAVKCAISRISLYGHKFEELGAFRMEGVKKRYFLFGLWPWQFGPYRKVALGKEFQRFHFVPLKKDFYFTDAQVELIEPLTSQTVILRGLALKSEPNQKVRLMLLTNLPAERATAEKLINLYLGSWPSLEEAFEDLSRKIELFTYTANSQRYFNLENLPFSRELLPSVTSLFFYHLRVLDAYVRWHFLPTGYEEKDYEALKEQFYQLKVKIEQQPSYFSATFLPPAGFAYLKDLAYACRRLNERRIEVYAGNKMWFLVGDV